MSWFSSTFSLSASPSPEQAGIRKGDEGDDSESPSGRLSAGKGVTDEFSELTKNLTRQLWGVASFLAPPLSTQGGSPKHTSTPQTVTQTMSVAGNSEDPVVATEEKEGTGSASVAGLSGVESPGLGEAQNEGGSPSAGGDRLTGFRSDLAELRGTVATGLSRIQTVIRAVTQDEDEDVEDDAAEDSLVDETSRNSGLSSLLKPLLMSMSSFRERIPRSERGEESPLVADDGDVDYEIQPKPTHSSSFGGSIGSLSRLASSFIPYARDIVGEFSGRDYYAVALTDEVVAFADNIARHSETWLDFPLPEEDDDDDFQMTEVQQEHAKSVEQLSSQLAAVHRELCPTFINNSRFWKIYFVLLHSRLSKEDANLLSTYQVLKTRELLLQQSQKEEPRIFDTAPTQSEREELVLTELNMVDLPYKHVALEEHFNKSSAESAPLPVMEEVSLEDASHPKPESSQESFSSQVGTEEEAHDSSSLHFAALQLEDEEADVDPWLDNEENDMKEIADAGAAVSIEEDVSFSDLEDDDECSKGEDGTHVVKRDLKCGNLVKNQASAQASHGDVLCGSKPEGDWFSVNEDDVASATSSSL